MVESTGDVDNSQAVKWMLCDMCLNLAALSLVKALDGHYPAWQIVFIRALIGFCLLVPLLLQKGTDTLTSQQWRWQLFRVLLSATALTASYYAVMNLPLAFFTTMNFTRPLLLLIMCAVFLKETITRGGWIGGCIGLIGVIVAVNPVLLSTGVGSKEDQMIVDPVGLYGFSAMLVTVVAGTAAVLVTRKLRHSSALTLMLFYTCGLMVLTAVPATIHWQAIQPVHGALLLGIGFFTQCAQFCFIQAHKRGDASVLAPLGYLSLLLASMVGLVFFSEVPNLSTFIGAGIIIAAVYTARRY